MKPINRDKIVRTITKYKGNNNKPDSYEIKFMTFNEFDSKTQFFYVGDVENMTLYPYPWYDIRWLYQIPAYWFLLRIFRNSPERINKHTHNKASIIVLIIEILLTIKSIVELIEWILKISE